MGKKDQGRGEKWGIRRKREEGEKKIWEVGGKNGRWNREKEELENRKRRKERRNRDGIRERKDIKRDKEKK